MTTLPTEPIVLPPVQKTILHKLVYHGVKTEFELIQQVMLITQMDEATCTQEIGKHLLALRRLGFVWTGVLTNRENQGMWVAAATTAGKHFIMT